MPTSLAVVRLDRDLPLPTRAHHDDAGVDLFSAVDVELAPGRRALVPTGLAVAIPTGMVGLIHPRSGLAARARLNAAGENETGYLDPLAEIVASGKVPAQRLLDLYNGEWAGDLSRIYALKSF